MRLRVLGSIPAFLTAATRLRQEAGYDEPASLLCFLCLLAVPWYRF